jgi:hypothetical protein
MAGLKDFTKDLYDNSINDMEWWVEALEKENASNTQAVSFIIDRLEKFFGEVIGDTVKVLVLTSASSEDVQGGTILNYIESGSPYYKGIDKSLWDIEMCFPLLDRDGKGENTLHSVKSVLSSMIHESIHLRLQKEGFFKLIEEVEKDTKVQGILKILKDNSGSYMNVTMELVTQYVTSYIENIFNRDIQYKGERKLFEYILDYEMFEEVIGANILSFVKYEKLEGPMSRLFNNWVSLVGYIPEEIEKDYTYLQNIQKKKGGHKDWRGSKVNIYKIAYELDLSLIEEYMNKGKEIDREFIERLYDILKSYLNVSLYAVG